MQIRALGENYETAALTVCTSFETMGLLAFKRIAPMDLVLDLAGGIVAVMARKLRQWNEDLREEQQQPSFAEWFEWLGDQALKRKPESAPGTSPAPGLEALSAAVRSMLKRAVAWELPRSYVPVTNAAYEMQYVRR